MVVVPVAVGVVGVPVVVVPVVGVVVVPVVVVLGGGSGTVTAGTAPVVGGAIAYGDDEQPPWQTLSVVLSEA